MNGAVAQWTELRIANPCGMGSNPIRPTISLSGYPVLGTPSSRNPVGLAKDTGLHPGRVTLSIPYRGTSAKEVPMNVLKPHKKLAILAALLEGCSARATSRLTGCHLETVLKVLVEAGEKCQAILDERINHIQCEAVECDELWSYVGMKERRRAEKNRTWNPEYGDAYTFVAIDPSTKLVISHLVGKRDLLHTESFIADLAKRIDGTTQLSTDGFPCYITTIDRHFGHRATHGELVKVYASVNPGPGRYAPPKVAGITKTARLGEPDRSKICTSYVERNNLTIRCQIRRFNRLTNAFSKKLRNLKASVSLWFCYYNFCRVHGSLRVTPAMEAGVTNSVWRLEDIVA